MSNGAGIGRPADRFEQGPRNGAQVALPGTSELVGYPDDPEQLTTYHECDAHTALVRGLAEYLGARKIDVGGRTVTFKAAYYDTAQPEDRSKYPAVNVYGIARGEYEAVQTTPRIERSALVKDKHFVSPAEFVQTLGIQLFCTSSSERTQLAALIEDALFPVPWMAGFRLRLPFYFGAFAVYEPASLEYLDSADAAIRRDRQSAFQLVGRLSVLQLRAIPTGQPRFEAKVSDSAKP